MAETLMELIRAHQTFEVDMSDYTAWFRCLCGESEPKRWGESMGDIRDWHAEHLADLVIEFEH